MANTDLNGKSSQPIAIDRDLLRSKTPLTSMHLSGGLDSSGALAQLPHHRVLAPSDRISEPQTGDRPTVIQAQPDDYLPPIAGWTIVCGMTMLGAFGSAIALSSVLTYKTAVQAPAVIRPQGELRIVQSTIDGSVASIAVRENQSVKPGDLIATVKDTRLESKLQTKRRQLAAEIHKGEQQVKNIDARLAALQLQGLGENEQSERTIAGIQSELSRAERDRRDKQHLSRAEVAEAQANIETAKRDKQAAQMELAVANANLKSVAAAHQAAVAKRDRYQSAGDTGAIAKNQLEEAKLSAEQQAQAVIAQQATIGKQQQNIARLEQIVVSAQARLARAQVALDPSSAEIAQVQHKIERERANAKTTIARYRQERQKLLQERLEIVNQMAANDREIAQIATDLQPTAIRAPIAGTIQNLSLRNNSQVLHPGDPIARILPSGLPMQIKASVALGDIDKVTVGEVVQMRVSGCPYTDYGLLSGRVNTVAADATGGKNSDASSPQLQLAPNTYEVTVKPDADRLGRGTNQCRIRSGMDGRVDIISKEETVLTFMLRKARLLINP